MSVTPDPRPFKRVSRREATIRSDWREQVFERDQSSCLVHRNPAECEWPPAAHHVVLAQRLRRDGHIDALNDRRIGMTVCSKAHRQHHAGTRVIRRDEVPAEVRAFVVELGYADWFERHYPFVSEEAA